MVETVRERFTCWDCEKISQAPAPFKVIARGLAWQSTYRPQADAVGAACSGLNPLLRLLEDHVMAAERLHYDDTTVPVLALGKYDLAVRTYVRNPRPLSCADSPAEMFNYSRNRK